MCTGWLSGAFAKSGCPSPFKKPTRLPDPNCELTTNKPTTSTARYRHRHGHTKTRQKRRARSGRAALAQQTLVVPFLAYRTPRCVQSRADHQPRGAHELVAEVAEQVGALGAVRLGLLKRPNSRASSNLVDRVEPTRGRGR
eukprot:scaffold22972_cov65-Phaeocystis_antarctica.AAC.1